MKTNVIILCVFGLLLSSCSEEPDSTTGQFDNDGNPIEEPSTGEDGNTSQEKPRVLLGGKINLDELYNYANQAIPDYINKDNTNSNAISNIEATLGRVLFYDTRLSSDQTVSCATCHQQAFAFGDKEVRSEGVNALTARHSMRLVNTRFAEESRFFWDERASSLEEQTTMPIRDHGEMGFSGTNGDPDFQDLLDRLSNVEYYQVLFMEAYGDQIITEERIQLALSQFIRSIQSFDSRYDEGRAMADNEGQNFSNFTQLENMGKRLFLDPPQFQGPTGNRTGGGLGCNGCHNAPEFDIDADSGNNGIIGMAGNQSGIDLDVTRSPSLRDIFSPSGTINSPLMHTGEFFTVDEVLSHYNDIQTNPSNNNLDPRLERGGGVQLNMTDQERDAIIAFLRTLTGQEIYSNEKWSDPFN